MAQARKVLLADPDVGAVRALTKSLRTRGYQGAIALDAPTSPEATGHTLP